MREEEDEDEMAIRSIGKADMHKIQCMPKRRNGRTPTRPQNQTRTRPGKGRTELSWLSTATATRAIGDAAMQMDRPSIDRPTRGL